MNKDVQATPTDPRWSAFVEMGVAEYRGLWCGFYMLTWLMLLTQLALGMVAVVATFCLLLHTIIMQGAWRINLNPYDQQGPCVWMTSWLSVLPMRVPIVGWQPVYGVSPWLWLELALGQVYLDQGSLDQGSLDQGSLGHGSLGHGSLGHGSLGQRSITLCIVAPCCPELVSCLWVDACVRRPLGSQ